jgi:poly-beta-1,6-N-acetyl-D-glucosamine synthase
MIYFAIILLISGIIYVSYIEHFRKGLSRIKSDIIISSDNNLSKVAVIVPARNEEKYIAETLNSVLNQNYPQDLLEVIAVDDRSSDSTGSIMDRMARTYPNLSVIHISEVSDNISPKKNAILTAVRSAESDLILTTDGDCVHDCNWVRSMTSLISGVSSSVTGVVAGLTVFEKKYGSDFESFWQNMQNIDYISHSLIAAGSIGNGRAFTANGSNLLVKKSLYLSELNNLKTELASGDDFFMIQSAQESNYKLKFAASRESIVRSVPVGTLKELMDQRSRWASKASYSSDFVLYFAINTFVFYSGLMLSFIFMISGLMRPEIFLAFYLIKFIPETIFLAYGFGKFGLEFKLRYYIPLQLFHIPFNLIAAVKGRYFGFEWKGVKYRL